MRRALALVALCVILALANGYGSRRQSYGGDGSYGGGGGYGSGGDGKDGCRRSVETFLKAYSAIYATQNASAVADFYSKETVVPTNQFDVLSGRDDIHGFYQAVFVQGSNNAVNHTIIEPDRRCQFAMVVGTFVLSSSDNPQGVVKRSGTFWEILKNENQVWQIDMQRLIFD